MRMQTGRFVMPTWKTGLVALIVQIVQCILAYYSQSTWVMAMPFLTAMGFVIFSEVMSIEERAEREDTSFLARYTSFGGVGTCFIAAVQLIELTDFIKGDKNPLTVFYNSVILSIIFLVVAATGRRIKPPQNFSNTTGWLMLAFVGIQTVLAFTRENLFGGIILIPNEMMFVTYACWISGVIVWFATRDRKSGLIGSLTAHFALVTGGGAIFEAFTREMPEYHKYTWQFTLGAAAIIALYGTLDYLVFRPRRSQVKVEFRRRK